MATRKKRPAPAKRARSALPLLPNQQLSLPAGYRHGTNQVASLRDVLSTKVRTVDGERLSREQRIALTKARIAAQTELKIASPTAGRIDKTRALDEVDRQTPLGQILVKIEHQAIEFLRETAAIRRNRRTARKKTSKRTTKKSSSSSSRRRAKRSKRSKPAARRRSKPSGRRRRR